MPRKHWDSRGKTVRQRGSNTNGNDAAYRYRSYGNELWEFDDNGSMMPREASINDVHHITETDRDGSFYPPVEERPGPDIPCSNRDRRSTRQMSLGPRRYRQILPDREIRVEPRSWLPIPDP